MKSVVLLLVLGGRDKNDENGKNESGHCLWQINKHETLCITVAKEENRRFVEKNVLIYIYIYMVHFT